MFQHADHSLMVKRPAIRPRGIRPRRNHIREWRQFRELTLQELADETERIALARGEQSGLTFSAIGQMERGDSGYSPWSLELLADALHCEPGDFLSRRPDMEIDPIVSMLEDVSPEERQRIVEAIRLLTARR